MGDGGLNNTLLGLAWSLPGMLGVHFRIAYLDRRLSLCSNVNLGPDRIISWCRKGGLFRADEASASGRSKYRNL